MNLHFVVPGFSKCGTTTLCALLAEHPAIFLPKVKEPGYFSVRTDRGWDNYAGLFAKAQPGQLCCEGSTTYSSAEFAAVARDRLLARFPDLKFIFIARNPICRIESSYRELHHNGHKWGVLPPLSLGETLRTCRNMIADTHYGRLFDIYRQRVPASRLLALVLEDFEQNPARELARCFEFLGVDPHVPIRGLDRKLNPASAKQYDTPAMRWIRRNRITAKLWRKLSARRQATLEQWFRLRRPFTGPVAWDEATHAWFLEQVADEARQFLAHAGKPADYWDLHSVALPQSAARAAA